MKLNRPIRVLLQIGVIFLVNLMIKGFDTSFGAFLDFTQRGILFTIFFLVFWLTVWNLANEINKHLSHKPFIIRVIINLFIGYTAGFLTNYTYRYGDIHWFGNSELWKDIPLFNPELTVSLLSIYMLIFGFDQFFKSSLRVKEEALKSEKLRKENAIARYMSLKAQIEPHFLFNSLSVLSSLVKEDSEMAEQFTVRLSRCLRYMVQHNEIPLVRLADEIQFVSDYFFLIKIRHPESISLINKLEGIPKDEVFIPPATLQLLIENAIHHNKHTAGAPLIIELNFADDGINVRNTLNRRRSKNSMGIGLDNIQQRFDLFSNKKIRIQENAGSFEVFIPALTLKEYENFNY